MQHQFHIPEMGTGFSIDTPIRVARFGISSAISLVDDQLIEQLRSYHTAQEGESYLPISSDHPDPRAARITQYLNLLNKVVSRQIAEMKSQPFENNSDIQRYFELLPDSPQKELYHRMVSTSDTAEKLRLESIVRESICAGSIDANIMTKLDCAQYRNGTKLSPEYNDAMAALRGFANSDVQSSVILSAGLNQRLYTYISEFPDFYPDSNGLLKKKIILKVNDFRSATIQARFLAKKGLWISEFRIESGLNCGGHAFPNGGQLIGPTLEEFKQKRESLEQSLWKSCVEVWKNKEIPIPDPYKMRVTVQGGIGTAAEQTMLLQQYGVDGTGWGSPFLLAPDVTCIDDNLVEQLLSANPEDMYLSDSSPLGVPFWSFRNSPSEQAIRKRIAEGTPGTPCAKGHLRFNTTFTDKPICVASREYQQKQLATLELSGPLTNDQISKITQKACICHEVGGSALRRHGISSNVATAICPGPNLVWFSKLTNLDEVTGHIYGRNSLITSKERPHMFIRELEITIDYFEKVVIPSVVEGDAIAKKSAYEFSKTIQDGINYYSNNREIFSSEEYSYFLTISKKFELNDYNNLH
jgi:hypothetical protein